MKSRAGRTTQAGHTGVWEHPVESPGAQSCWPRADLHRTTQTHHAYCLLSQLSAAAAPPEKPWWHVCVARAITIRGYDHGPGTKGGTDAIE